MRSPSLIVAGVALALSVSGCGLTDARNEAIANAKVTPAPLGEALRPGLVGLNGYPSTGWDPTDLATDKVPTLAGIGLTPADVPSDISVKLISDGTSLGLPTLDFCNGSYPSELLRVQRVQRGTFDKDGVYAGLSTEVVRYQSSAAAKQALQEMVTARKNCPVGKTVKTYDGHKIVFQFHPAFGQASTALMPLGQRLVIHTTMKVDGNPQTAFLVFQIDGPVLVGLYASSASGKPFNTLELDSFFTIAGEIGIRLREYTKASV